MPYQGQISVHPFGMVKSISSCIMNKDLIFKKLLANFTPLTENYFMIFFLLFTLCMGNVTYCRISENEALEKTRLYIEQLTKDNKFSGVLLVAKQGKQIFNHVVGIANREKNIHNKLSTQFNLASMGKMFTGIAITQLAQQGKLKFEDTIANYLPDYPNKIAAQKTIYQLLTHTSQLGDIFGPEFEKQQDLLKTPNDYIKCYGNRDPEFLPEGSVIYSNYSYIVLGAIVEKISGLNFDDYVHKYIFHAAEMKDSTVYNHEYTSNECAIGYDETKAVHFTGIGSPAGGSYATANDILQFAQALMTYKLLNKEYTQLATTGKVKAVDGSYGYGFMDCADEDGVRWFGHSGGCIGMNTELRIYPKSGYIIIMLSNSNRWRPSIVSEYVGKLLPAE